MTHPRGNASASAPPCISPPSAAVAAMERRTRRAARDRRSAAQQTQERSTRAEHAAAGVLGCFSTECAGTVAQDLACSARPRCRACCGASSAALSLVVNSSLRFRRSTRVPCTVDEQWQRTRGQSTRAALTAQLRKQQEQTRRSLQHALANSDWASAAVSEQAQSQSSPCLAPITASAQHQHERHTFAFARAAHFQSSGGCCACRCLTSHSQSRPCRRPALPRGDRL